MYCATVQVSLKKGVADPEGANVRKTLALMGYEVLSVSTVKTYEISLEASSKKEAQSKLEEICQKLLANPVIHNYKYELVERTK